MTQPFIDCALQLRRQLNNNIDAIATITCKVGEGTVHRLWEPLAEKRRPTTSYSAKFSVPYCIAVALVDGAAGLQQFSDDKVRDARVLALAERIGYEVDPANEYPRNYSGHVLVTLADGSRRAIDQPHLRGGAREPLSDQELLEKFRANVAFGGWPAAQAETCRDVLAGLFKAADLDSLNVLRA
jgi:2-methylcitrate dehydratase PrpD